MTHQPKCCNSNNVSMFSQCCGVLECDAMYCSVSNTHHDCRARFRGIHEHAQTTIDHMLKYACLLWVSFHVYRSFSGLFSYV